VKIMLFREAAANEFVSASPEPEEEVFLAAPAPRRAAVAAPDRRGPAVACPVAQGDTVVFARLDLAEILGIWRHARGRVVGIHDPGSAAATVDVTFEGHETLERYLPDLFRRVH
jgi:hypothetical protein